MCVFLGKGRGCVCVCVGVCACVRARACVRGKRTRRYRNHSLYNHFIHHPASFIISPVYIILQPATISLGSLTLVRAHGRAQPNIVDFPPCDDGSRASSHITCLVHTDIINNNTRPMQLICTQDKVTYTSPYSTYLRPPHSPPQDFTKSEED